MHGRWRGVDVGAGTHVIVGVDMPIVAELDVRACRASASAPVTVPALACASALALPSAPVSTSASARPSARSWT
ncbi:hypothetical protein [Embleya sp. NPDC059237]|uniref:hypothetical protein n=1 Tax=Embleya sp. NPDC059237 TaxID=3346784 RepID=UPI0036909A1D